MRGGLSAAALERVLSGVAPDGRVTRVRPLRGGISSSVHLVHLATPTGRRDTVVVRRYGAYSQEHDPQASEREYRLLQVLARLGQPVPRPLLLETANGAFNAPTVVMTRIAGQPLLAPRDVGDYVRQLATALLALHRLPADQFAFLPTEQQYVERALREDLKPRGDPLHEAVWREARRLWPSVTTTRRTLVHGDYWPGNVLFRRGRLVGIVDWEQAWLADPTRDVATCRGDLSILFGLAAADAFLDAYLAAGGQVSNLEFWHLLISTWAVREIREWASVYPLLGRSDVSPELAEQRIRAFASAALDATMGR
jgi:aminoglycoside phosphotransferase (APT) family kinase protein